MGFVTIKARIADYDTYKKVYDGMTSVRKEWGCVERARLQEQQQSLRGDGPAGMGRHAQVPGVHDVGRRAGCYV